MGHIETDYLVVGAGASGMAFVDSLVEADDGADVVLVDRRHAPGGHWLDAYPFVRLHQPSANYGVNSKVLGHDRIDESGPNAGFYDRATAPEICSYFSSALDDLVATGRVRFMGVTDYRGQDGQDGRAHILTSLLTGATTTVTVRKRLVDATYVESDIPSRHTPGFMIDRGVRLIPPNDLVDLHQSAGGFTVLGAGKTAMDTCVWLLENGVEPDRIRWFRPREPWLFNRAAMQPLEQVGAYMHLQASWVQAAAEATDGADFARRLEADGVFLRIDPDVEPLMFRGPTVSTREVEQLRAIEQVTRQRKVRRIGTDRIVTDDGDVATDPGQIYVDCTAAGVRATVPQPVFAPGRITLQYVTIGIVPWSAATIGFVEAAGGDDDQKNSLCPPVVFGGSTADVLQLAYAGMNGLLARAADPAVNAWTEASRLNPAKGAAEHLDDPRVGEAFTRMGTHLGAAMANLGRLVGGATPAPA